MKRFAAILFVIVMLLGTVSVGAVTPYDTYTYDIDGVALKSPDAYVPDEVITVEDMGLDTKGLNTPSDLVFGHDGSVYIADTKNNRIVVLNSNYKLKFYITGFVNYYGVVDTFDKPQGVFATEENIYVADTENSRLVVFDLDGNYVRTLNRPSSDIFEAEDLYKPIAVAVDKAGRIYVVSSTTYQGVMSLSSEGEFQGYIGAQKVTVGLIDRMWRSIMTKDQRKSTTQFVSTEFNNLTVDSDGFVYVTTSSIAETLQQSAIISKASTNAPVKKINTSGTDIMKRNGFFGPGGEVFDGSVLADPIGASKIVDVAVGPYGTWSIIDAKRSKVYTYNENGDLLFVFGDKGAQVGNMQSLSSICYNGTSIVLLDNTQNTLSIFKRTEYGDLLLNALYYEDQRQYDVAAGVWEDIIQRNSNFDAAYIGIGRALDRSGQYKEAMEYYKSAYDTEDYSTSFQSYRKDWISKYIWVLPLVLIAVILLYRFFFKYANKTNKAGNIKTTKRTYLEEVIYSVYLIFHPFDGFWDLKHEKRGSMRGALTILALAIVSFGYYMVGSSYLIFPHGGMSNVLLIILSIALPVALWTVSNWCLTTLFDGEGSMKDIFIATCYSLTPMVLLMIPATICTNFLTLTEMPLLTLVLTFSYIWTGLLIFFGMMVTHDYTFFKNIIISICTIVAMAFIMFIAVLFTGLISNIVGFITSIAVELSYRV